MDLKAKIRRKKLQRQGQNSQMLKTGVRQGMAGPKCLILNRMQIPPFSDTDAVRLGTVTG